MSAELLFYCLSKCFNSFVLHEVYTHGSAHSLSEIKTLLISIYSTDVLDTHGTKNCNTDQTDWSASLYNNSAVETKDSGCFCSLNCMYKYCTWLDEDTGIQVKIAYVEECASKLSTSDKDVIREPSVKMNVIIWKKSVYVSATYVNVTIEIGPVLKSKSFTNLPIQIEGLEAGYNASMSRVNASVMITAPQNWLNALQSRDIRLVCDASGLAPGTYSLPVLCRIDADEDEEISVEVVPGNVSVTITVE